MPDVSLSLIVLKTNQLEVVAHFYESIGIELVEEQHGTGPLHYAARLGGTVLEIYPLAEGAADSTTRLGFVVEDLGAVMECLWRRELAPLKKARQTEWGLCRVVKDPDGRSVELYQREPNDKE